MAELSLAEDVDWKAGDLIFVAAAGFDPSEGETAVIKSVSGSRISLTQPLQHNHNSSDVLSADQVSTCIRAF